MRLVVTVPWGERLGGAESMLWCALRHLDRSEVDLVVAFLKPGRFEREVAALGIKTAVFDSGRLRDPRAVARTVLALTRLFRRTRPHVILNWSAKTQLYGGTAALIAGMSRRVVWWQHAVPGRHWMDRLATLLPASAVGCSSRAARDAQGRLLPRRPAFVVHPGVEVNGPAPAGSRAHLQASLGIPPERSVVGVLGRLQPWKGQHRVIEAIAALKSAGRDVHGLIVGGDAYALSPDYERRLRELVDERGLGERITFTGQVDDPSPYIQLMDVLVNASENEPFGIVLLEAMVLEVPVVARASAGPMEIVEQGVSGVLLPTTSATALASGIEQLLGDAGRRAEIARAGRRRCVEVFSAPVMAATLQRNLEKVARAQA